MNHGVASKAYKAESSIQDSGCVKGSRNVFNAGLAARNASSMPLVTSRVWLIEPQLSFKLSNEGNGKAGPCSALPSVFAKRSAIDIGAFEAPD